MESLQWWQWLAQFGAAFAFAVVMVYIYTKTVDRFNKSYKDHCESTELRMKALMDEAINSMKENTRATGEMATMLRVINGKLTNNH